MIKLNIAIPTAGKVPAAFAYSLAGMVAKVAADKIPTMPEASLELAIDVVESSNWITNREQLAKRAIEQGRTHLMFLDDDMSFDPRVLEIMLGRRQPIVVTNYLIKTTPARDFVAVSEDGQRRIQTKESSTGLEPCAYSGFGVSIIETEVFRKTQQPWFLPEFNPETSTYTTEDNPFFARARAAGFRVWVDHDASKLINHIGQKSWHWSEVNHA